MKKIIKDTKGVTTIEFAMICLPMFMLIMGSIEMGFMMFIKARAEAVLGQAARMSVTGDKNKIGVSGENIDNFVRENLTFTSGAVINVDKRFYDKFSQVNQPERRLSNATEAPYCFIDINDNEKWDADPSRSGTGGADDVIDYKVNITYNALFPLITNTVTGKNKISLEARTSLRNEPFAGNTDLKERTCCVSASEGNPVTCQD